MDLIRTALPLLPYLAALLLTAAAAWIGGRKIMERDYRKLEKWQPPREPERPWETSYL